MEKTTRTKVNNKKTVKLSLFKLLLMLITLVFIIILIFWGIDKLKNNKQNSNSKNNYIFELSEETKQRISNIKEEVSKRESKISEINDGRLNPKDYSELDVNDFLSRLQKDKLYLPTEGDEFIANVIRIKGEKIEVKDYKIENNKAVETKENNSLLDGKPQILVTDKAIYDEEGNILSKLSADNKPLFNGVKNGDDYIIQSLDKEDRDLTSKIQVKYSTPVNEWKSGNTYKVTYTVKDSSNNEVSKEITVKVLDANSKLQ